MPTTFIHEELYTLTVTMPTLIPGTTNKMAMPIQIRAVATDPPEPEHRAIVVLTGGDPDEPDRVLPFRDLLDLYIRIGGQIFEAERNPARMKAVGSNIVNASRGIMEATVRAMHRHLPDEKTFKAILDARLDELKVQLEVEPTRLH